MASTVPLLRSLDWDFNWQDVYHFANRSALPAGTTVAMTISYDNSSKNPRNPNTLRSALATASRRPTKWPRCGSRFFRCVPPNAGPGRQRVSKGAAGGDQGTRIDAPPRPAECRVAR